MAVLSQKPAGLAADDLKRMPQWALQPLLVVHHGGSCCRQIGAAERWRAGGTGVTCWLSSRLAWWVDESQCMLQQPPLLWNAPLAPLPPLCQVVLTLPPASSPLLLTASPDSQPAQLPGLPPLSQASGKGGGACGAGGAAAVGVAAQPVRGARGAARVRHPAAGKLRRGSGVGAEGGRTPGAAHGGAARAGWLAGTIGVCSASPCRPLHNLVSMRAAARAAVTPFRALHALACPAARSPTRARWCPRTCGRCWRASC